jgi:large subunit ribosomal protein L21
MYAYVQTGGKQYRAAPGDVLTVEKIDAGVGDAVSLRAVLIVDGAEVTSDAAALEGASVTGEVVGHVKGPKIRMHHFKNKTGYHRRQGHRQQLTQVKVTGIDTK